MLTRILYRLSRIVNSVLKRCAIYDKDRPPWTVCIMVPPEGIEPP